MIHGSWDKCNTSLMPSAATVAVPAFGLMSTQRTCSRCPDLVVMSPSSPGPKVWLLIIAKTRGGVPKMDFKVSSASDGPLIWLLGSPAKTRLELGKNGSRPSDELPGMTKTDGFISDLAGCGGGAANSGSGPAAAISSKAASRL